MIVVIKPMLSSIKVVNYRHLTHASIVITINTINSTVSMDIVYPPHRLRVPQPNESPVMIQMAATPNEGKQLARLKRDFHDANQSLVRGNYHYVSFSTLSKTKTSSQEKMSLPTTNRFTSPITAFRRKKKTPSHTNDPGKFLLH